MNGSYDLSDKILAYLESREDWVNADNWDDLYADWYKDFEDKDGNGWA